jgi:hypothetical protein
MNIINLSGETVLIFDEETGYIPIENQLKFEEFDSKEKKTEKIKISAINHSELKKIPTLDVKTFPREYRKRIDKFLKELPEQKEDTLIIVPIFCLWLEECRGARDFVYAELTCEVDDDGDERHYHKLVKIQN